MVRRRSAGQWRLAKSLKARIKRPARSGSGALAAADPIADPGPGLDQIGRSGRSELVAQVSDVAVDRSVGDGEAGAVQPVDDIVAGEDLGGQAGEQQKELELGDGDRHLNTVPEG